MSESEHIVRVLESPYVCYDPCGVCGSNDYVCECGWSGCLSAADDESRAHREVYRNQDDDEYDD